ncbi:Mechanosensitive ion channel-domain-containing protein, partial [Vararia minispora EC-137]
FNEKGAAPPAGARDHKQKPSVHYPDDIATPTYRYASHGSDIPTFDTENPMGPSGRKLERQNSIATDDGDDDEDHNDYDWSADEDLGEEEAKFEQRMGKNTRPKGWFRRLLSMLFGSLIGTIVLAGILVAGPILVYEFWYKPHPSESRRYTLDNVEAWLFWAAANLVISWWLALIVDLIPSTARWVVGAFWGHVSEAVKSNIELYNSVDDNIKPVLYAASGWVSWIIIFENIYTLHSTDSSVPSRASYTDRLSQVVEFLFFAALVWCIQRMASHAIAFAFHRVAFKERIEDLRSRLRVIEYLRDYRPKKRRTARPHSGVRTPLAAFLAPGTTPVTEKMFSWTGSHHAGAPSGMHSDGELEGDGEAGSPSSKGKGKRAEKRHSGQGKNKLSKLIDSPSRVGSPSAENAREQSESPHRYPPSRSDSPSRHWQKEGDDADMVANAAKALKSAVLHDARNIQGRDATESGLAWDVTSPSEAKRLARRLYETFRDRRRNYLLPQDFEPAYPTAEEAQAAFRVFDEDNNGDISREEIKTTLIKTYKERRFLSRSIHDVSNALHTLNLILFAFGVIILFLISLSVFGIDITKTLTSFYSIAIAASFVFRSSAAGMFDSIMFLFVTHPFDTGDRCFIGTENLVVKKMGLFATVFTRADGAETYYFNSQLFSMFITNARRSDKTSETMTMQMEWHTPMEKIDALEKALNDWLAHEKNRWFVPNTSIVFQNFQLQRYLEVSIGISHNGNWQDWGLRNSRRTAFQAAVQHYCLQLGIKAYKPSIPIRWVDPGADVPPSP